LTLLLGADLGTTSLKLAVVTHRGSVRAEVRIPYAIRITRDGRAECDPRIWWRAFRAGLARLSRHAPLRDIAAIGLCGQTRAQVFLDRTGRILRSAILWADRRALAEAEELSPATSSNSKSETQTAPHSPAVDATAPLARLLWMRRHEPDVLQATHRLLQPKDFLVYRLTGEWAADIPGSYHLLASHDPPRPASLLETLVPGRDLLPPLFAPWQVVAQVTARSAREAGLRPGTPVVAGTQDGLCTAIGAGAARVGVGVDITGSTDTVGLFTSRPPAPSSLAVLPLLPDLVFCGGPTQVSGEAVRWFGDAIVRASSPRRRVAAEAIERLASQSPAGAEGLLFLPYLLGERAPGWDARARGVFFGLSPRHGLTHFARAVLEGIAMSVRRILGLAETSAGMKVGEVRVAGAAGSSQFWNRLKADILGRPICQPAVAESGALGAALLAAVGVGCFADIVEAGEQMVRVARTYLPGEDVGRYDGLFPIYQDLSISLAPSFARLHAWGRSQGRPWGTS
jgi:xylulokinase